LALAVSGAELELVEVSLKAKPSRMLELSPKGTVPVVELDDGTVLEESLDIMLWTLGKSDPQGWLGHDETTLQQMLAVIENNDGDFKHHLDRTKYAVRYEGADPEVHRTEANRFLSELSKRLNVNPYLMGPKPMLLDWAVLPFVRQFANIDRARFDTTTDPALRRWLNQGLNSDLFKAVMQKGSQWAGL
jgi:glutathione S-transferase